MTTFRLDLDVASAGSTGTRLHVGYALRDTRVLCWMLYATAA